LRFRIHCDSGMAEMGKTLITDGSPVTLHVDLSGEGPFALFVLKNGLPCTYRLLPQEMSGWQKIEVVDHPHQDCYYRIEVHTVRKEIDYSGIQWRDYTTMRALSNPIWVTHS